MQGILQQMFEAVELSEPGPEIVFSTPNLAGFFNVKTLSVRYDYPDPNLTVYRAEVEMLVEFRTFEHELVWSTSVRGEGAGYSDNNSKLSEFSQNSAAALEDAFQKAVDEIEAEIYKSPRLREYFRSRLAGA